MHELIAAIDLGSNSFRLQVGRIVNDQVYPLDGLKESVRLAAGLTPDKLLDLASQQRGLEALRRFNERLRGFGPDSMRAVATNTLRVAKNAPQFLAKAEAALGAPIEVIAGREEARLIYVGVAHTLPDPHRQQLVVDIGGGSTEFIIGRSFQPIVLESLYMGCVTYSLRYFPDGRIDKRALKEAEFAARRELLAIAHVYREVGWEVAVGSSGSAKALVDALEQNGLSGDGITAQGLEALRAILLRAGHLDRLDLAGVKGDRIPVLLGGFAIMSAVFKEFGLEQMTFSEGALRLGVLYDLLGRYHHHDLRAATVSAFTTRYQVDVPHADAVAQTACHLLACLDPDTADEEHPDRLFLSWAARLHEIGVSVAHSSYHKHSAYILANADMPGFSRMDQGRLSRIVLAHRGKLARVSTLDENSPDWMLIVCLRLAHLLHRARDGRGVPPISIARTATGFAVTVRESWLRKLPLTAAALEEEQRQWLSVGRGLILRTQASPLPTA
ncbi:MAG: exopolyphosphatase [Rhodocyclaceae bacterium]|jgi:exopolyphosphatase/guanosine-5'-triphosphate,3'-diphosphate pyrophosphatase|nr:exopolyphosphatase [Rhodocyclaceae bacterium]